MQASDPDRLSAPDRRPDRRQLLALGVGIFLVGAIPVAGRRRRRIVRRQIPVMGTYADLAVVGVDDGCARVAIEAALAELRDVDRCMTRFTVSSDVGQANARAAREAVVLGPRTAEVVAEALRWAAATDGAFDPCLGRLTQLWDVTRRTAPPAAEELARFADRRLYRAVELGGGARRPTLRFADPEVGLDLGGIAKGHAVDRAVQALRAHGIRHGLVNVGGDLFVLGTSPDGNPWRVGVRSPTDPSRLSHTLELTDTAAATSGDYARAFQHRGRRFHHLLDAASAAPRQTAEHSLTIVADACMTADAAATAVFGMPEERALAVLASVAPDASIANRRA